MNLIQKHHRIEISQKQRKNDRIESNMIESIPPPLLALEDISGIQLGKNSAMD